MKRGVAVILHEHEWKHNLHDFAIWHLAKIWEQEGIKVHFLFGPRRFVPADVAILHVDLTVVPQEYIEFAEQYPIAVNSKVRDIRKSSISRIRVFPEDGYRGPVIVKSELNYAGQPERRLLGTALSRAVFRIACRWPLRRSAGSRREPNFRSPSDYIICNSPGSVPIDWFHRNDILVERFVPEIQDGFYCLRSFSFLGSSGVCTLRKAKHPIVNLPSTVHREVVEVHPEILQLKRSLGFDYGKFDYVIHEGVPVLLDANKTPGSGRDASYFAICAQWARGIHSYF